MNKASSQKAITVRYFAQLREQAKINIETISTEAETAVTLYDELSQRHGFSLEQVALRVAVNGAYANWNQSIADGDEVVFIPPVAGG
ncbi:MAG: molybdopterin converting factor subunit 1 [Gammaproteobacteria bacterium]